MHKNRGLFAILLDVTPSAWSPLGDESFGRVLKAAVLAANLATVSASGCDVLFHCYAQNFDLEFEPFSCAHQCLGFDNFLEPQKVLQSLADCLGCNIAECSDGGGGSLARCLSRVLCRTLFYHLILDSADWLDCTLLVTSQKVPPDPYWPHETFLCVLF